MMVLSAWHRLSPATRVAAGLVSLLVSLILIADLFIGFLKDPAVDALRRHEAVSALLAAELPSALRGGQPSELQGALASAKRLEPLLLSAAIVSRQGEVLASIGAHAEAWVRHDGDKRDADSLRLPVAIDGRPWGEVQLAFQPARPASLRARLKDRTLLGIAFVALLGFVGFQLYLRRVLRYLDPSEAVPERVRTAFDTLTEGVLVLDAAGQVLLANSAVRQWQPPDAAPASLIGLSAESLGWLTAALPPHSATQPLPWRRAMLENRALLGVHLSVAQPGRAPRQLVMNCSPISDGTSAVRGCLTTFSDVTELHERTEHLRLALAELNASQAEIARQNEELTRLATRDPLTGCLNRRSFVAGADPQFAKAASGLPLSVIVCDIDHFKQVNDRYGHAAGDRVIQGAAKTLQRNLRIGDLLARYGGEEFCILLPDATRAQAMEIAERLRLDIQLHLGAAIREPADVKVTMSFGVAQWQDGVADLTQLIDIADQALYLSKQGGRNRVTLAAELPAPACA